MTLARCPISNVRNGVLTLAMPCEVFTRLTCQLATEVILNPLVDIKGLRLETLNDKGNLFWGEDIEEIHSTLIAVKRPMAHKQPLKGLKSLCSVLEPKESICVVLFQKIQHLSRALHDGRWRRGCVIN